MATTTVPIDDQGMLADLMADEPAQAVEQPVEQQPEPQAEPPAEIEGRARDEHGRFVAKEPEAAPVAAQPPEPKEEGGQVPSWRLRELREAREAAERRAEEYSRQSYAQQQQLAALQRQLSQLQQPQAEPVDFFQNPDGALDQRIAPVRNEIEQFKAEIRLEMSRELAVVKHGEQAVTDMERGIEEAMRSGHPEIASLAHRMRSSNNPAGIAMQWYQNQKIVKETGGDLTSFRQKVLDEAMKDPAFQAKVLETARGQAPVAQNGRPNIQLPPSLSRIPGSAPERSGDDGDMSDAGIFKHAMR